MCKEIFNIKNFYENSCLWLRETTSTVVLSSEAKNEGDGGAFFLSKLSPFPKDERYNSSSFSEYFTSRKASF